jgi:hypothetical protein
MEETKKYVLEFANIVGMELNNYQLNNWIDYLKTKIDEREKQ